jgi:cytochrome c-type biogenesis protein CcmH
MLYLWLGVALLSFVAILFVIYPVWKQFKDKVDTVVTSDPQRDNVEVFKDRLHELEQEVASGSLSQEDFTVLKTELEKNLLIDASTESRSLSSQSISTKQFILASFIAFVVVAGSLGLYAKVGSAPALEVALNMAEDPFDGREPTLQEAIDQLRKELELQPANPEGWYILASTLMGQQDYQGALEAYQNTLAYLTPQDVQYATVMGQLAQSMFFVAGGMTPEVRDQVEKTLAAEPFEITALGILGIDAFERKAYRDAIGFWSKALINSDGESAQSLRNGVERARNELIALGEDVSDIELPVMAAIPVTVSVAAELLANVPAETPVFIVARPLEGGMPLAGVRLTVADLPVELVLSDANAMTPQARLSGYETVSVSARISLSGDVTPQAGDMIAEITDIPTKGLSQPLEIVVSEVVK